jgi:predicted flap endonuclease-1-like 5' DNA nuclease
MTLSIEQRDQAAIHDRAVMSLSLPIGLANPLWLAFGAAASAGAAWWLMTCWARPTNLEAATVTDAVAIEPPSPTAPALDTVPEPLALTLVEAEAAAQADAPAEPDTPVEMALAAAEVAVKPAEERAIEDVAATPSELAPEPAIALAAAVEDDLTRLVGVGPRTAAALAARGVTRFAELAAWTADELAAFDAEMRLKGRSLRNAWLEQARRLAEETPAAEA